jgi:hypothetical protein
VGVVMQTAAGVPLTTPLLTVEDFMVPALVRAATTVAVNPGVVDAAVNVSEKRCRVITDEYIDDPKVCEGV